MKRKRINPFNVSAIVFLFLFCGTLTFLLMKDGKKSSAASTASFTAGNIISDYMMTNYSTMTEADIQTFLKSKNTCNKSLPSSGYTDEGDGFYSNTFGTSKKYMYHIKNGKFVCLADEIFGSGNEFGETVKNGETAAHIIWQTAQDFKINPQVLLVLLEKEQGLISDDWPNNYQYRAATGYGCPDTAACDAKYYGFKNQVRKAAELFRTVLDGGWTNYPLGNNYIQYNPDKSCGGSTVDIENLATSALYRYTPYQPNQAALNAGYGTAPCGAYGNRNFYLYFSDWFGNPKESSVDVQEKKADNDTKKEENPSKEKQEPLGVNSDSTMQTRQQKIAEVEKQYNDLGSKIGEIETNSKTGIYWQEYQNGFIVGNERYGYFLSAGEIRKIWEKNGFESGYLGFPIHAMEYNSHTDTYYQEFVGGFVVGDGKHGFHVSAGEIRKVWASRGFESGDLGAMIGDMEYNSHTDTYYQEFVGGFVVGDGKHGFHVSAGEIRKVWASRGFESGDLGAMIGDMEYNKSLDSYSQTFVGGVVLGSGKTGYYVSMGIIREQWQKAGGEVGKYGFPVGDIIKKGSRYEQRFQNGTISV